MRWMQFMPWASNRRCSQCGREFFRWCGCIAMRHSTAQKACFIFWVAFIALVIIGVGYIFSAEKKYNFFGEGVDRRRCLWYR